ncbi:hypothetical protein E2542_SST02687 [Spatholobus suberectus]|nr:hypothetical protein E2542_SST02687 [Spatholobus suberectus]
MPESVAALHLFTPVRRPHVRRLDVVGSSANHCGGPPTLFDLHHALPRSSGVDPASTSGRSPMAIAASRLPQSCDA